MFNIEQNKYRFFRSFTIYLWINFYARKKEKRTKRKKRGQLPKAIDLVNNESQVCCVMYVKESKTEKAPKHKHEAIQPENGF